MLPKMGCAGRSHGLGELELHDQLNWGVPGPLICFWYYELKRRVWSVEYT